MNNLNATLEMQGLVSQEIEKLPNAAKLKILGIDSKKEKSLELIELKKIYHIDDEMLPAEFRHIRIEKLVGLNNRPDQAANWISLLFDLHKQHIFSLFKDRKNFENYVSRLDAESEDLPWVLVVDGEYFIDGEGKHRLTIAKCLELKEFPVLVRHLKNFEVID